MIKSHQTNMPMAEKQLKTTQLPKISVQVLLTDSHLTAITLDGGQSRPLHKRLILYIRLAFTPSHCVFFLMSPIFSLHVNMFI